MKKTIRLSEKPDKEKKNFSDTDKTVLKLQRQEKIMTIAIYSLLIITTISIMLIIFILLLKG
ncbi:Hypothetical protein IALB_3181 [Ignavibacterium album JCM 16511]|uniref:Uncharacterized protein n=1 Tax=Ignavibacterium album (strain DSM 19864 / JCM 16511 / NBRC 101810 / Mat9-16) TaxID=945713 RepID=I0APH7_IGNAJ|nr:hypothetical protein [Ignavibacterium album]AFH50884.1 Hypothetical protein IALB_3181 [Ignavibacterium album JCM 16511]